MTGEKKREQLLKRILPGLAIIVIYFVFVSSMISEKMKKAETDYKNLAMSGVSKEALPSVLSQQQQTQQQLTEIQTKVNELQDKMKGMAGFLTTPDSSSNAAMNSVTKILDSFDIKLSKDQKEQLQEAQLSPALKEVWQALKTSNFDDKKPANSTGETPNSSVPQQKTVISVHHLLLKGNYFNMYKALTALAKPTLNALPVSLTMQMPESDETSSGELEWELILWM